MWSLSEETAMSNHANTVHSAAVGDRFRDRDGHVHVVVRIEGEWEEPRILAEEEEVLTGTLDWAYTADNADRNWGPLEPIGADPRVTEIVTRHSQRQRDADDVMKSVPGDLVPELMRCIEGSQHCSWRMAQAQAQEIAGSTSLREAPAAVALPSLLATWVR